MKGINLNTRPQEQPQDTYRYGKNGISNDALGTEENEPGFALMQGQWPYMYNGYIPTDKYPVIFSTDNVNSAIGYYDTDNDAYIPIFDDVAKDFKLGLNTDYYVTGQAQRNHQGEVVVAFTNKHAVIGYLNCDNPDTDTLESLRLFPALQPIPITVTQESGGILAPGAYFAAVRCSRADGTITPYVGISQVSIVAGSGEITDRTLVLSLENIDVSYDYIEVAIIHKRNGVFQTPQLMTPVGITGESMQLTYTGSEITTDTTLESILIPQASYTRIGTIGQLNDALYIGDLESEVPINMQRWVNMIQVRWKSELIDVTNPPEEHKQGEKRSFAHEEVAALYIQFSKTSGGWTSWFHIPGRPPSGGDLVTSALGTAQGMTVPKYKVEDTISTVNTTLKTGSMGIWVNENETYPDHPDFNSEDLGGVDLRGQQVYHHRFPSVRYCKETLYSSDNNYGKTHLDLLGLEIDNVQIPAEYQDKITGWRIGYAKRSPGNSTFQGQSIMLHSAREGNWNNGNPMIVANANRYISTGGNFHSGKENRMDNTLVIDPTLVRMHAFDMLFNRPAISGDGYYLSVHLKLRRNSIPEQGFMEDFNLGFDDVYGPTIFLVDYTVGETPALAVSNKQLRRVIDPIRIEANLTTGRWYNIEQESAYGAKLSQGLLDTADILSHQVSLDTNNQDPNGVPDHEMGYLASLMRLRDDCYAPFTAQKIIVASNILSGISGTVFGGDTYLSDYTFHTYGWYTSINQRPEPTIGGTKVVRRIICETAANLHGRFETPGNIYSQWYPKSGLSQNDADGNYPTRMDTRQDPNQFGYNKDFNTLSELSVDTGVYNTLEQYNNLHPFRIARGGKLGRQDKTRSWRTWLPLDYYENVKNFGRVLNLDGQDDRLLIHMEKALMLSQDKTKLESDVLAITLGTADIFQFEPQDVASAPQGYAGTTHDLGCLRTPFGYFFFDMPLREAFLFKKQLDPMGKGLFTTFRDIAWTKAVNPLQGDGITAGYDPKYKRILMTVRQTVPADGSPVLVNPTDEQLAGIPVGTLVYMHGRILRYDGLNNPVDTGYVCPGEPIIPDVPATLTVSIQAGTYVNQQIAQIPGTNVETFSIHTLSPATNIFTVNATTGVVTLTGTVSMITPVYAIGIKATSSTGDEDICTLTVTITP